MNAPKPPRWVAPYPEQKVRYAIWMLFHWRRMRAFKAYMRRRIDELLDERGWTEGEDR